MTRKATDILLDIEKSIKDILGHMSNHSMLLSNLANRISALESGNVSSPSLDQEPILKQPVESISESAPVKRSTMPGLKSNVTLDNGILVKNKPSEVTSPGSIVGKKKLSKKIIPAKGNQHNGTPVQQKVQYPDGKPVANANVEITLNGEMVYKTKTNATGKWTGGVKPGDYSINVYKKGTSRRPEVNIQSSVSISSQSDPLQLDHLKMED